MKQQESQNSLSIYSQSMPPVLILLVNLLRRNLKLFKSFRLNDICGVFSASTVLLPQAMAFSVALLTPYTNDAASAAIAGMIAVAAISLMSGLSGGTAGMVSAPTGPTMILLGGVLASLAATGLSGQPLINALFLVMMTAGLAQIIIGITGSGRLIKLIPYPVVAGFMTGSALVMIISQFKLLGISGYQDSTQWLPTVVCCFTLVTIAVVDKWLPKIPSALAGLSVGTIVFHLLLAWVDKAPDQWIVGSLPSLSDARILPSINTLSGFPWEIIIISGIALAILSSLDTLFTSVIADNMTGNRHNAKKELTGQGLGYILSALFGGIAGAGTTAGTIIAIKSKARYWVGVSVCAVFISMIFFIGPVVAILPVSALAAVIIYVALASMIKHEIFAWVRRPRTRTEALTAILVTVVTVTYDLMIAVGVGVAIAILQFLHSQITIPVIRRRITANEYPSLRKRSDTANNILQNYGSNIAIYELQGNLFFGTVERLFEKVIEDLDRPIWLILDLSHVQQVDLTAMKMLCKMAERIQERSGQLILCNAHRENGFGKNIDKTIRKINPINKNQTKIKSFVCRDEAIEYAENQLLKKQGHETKNSMENQTLNLAQVFNNFNKEDLSAVNQMFKKQIKRKGDILFKAGDITNALYVIESGEVDVVLPYSKKRYTRLAKLTTGCFIGEPNFLQISKASVEARVVKNSNLLVLTREEFNQLFHTQPRTAAKLLAALGHQMSDQFNYLTHKLSQHANFNRS